MNEDVAAATTGDEVDPPPVRSDELYARAACSPAARGMSGELGLPDPGAPAPVPPPAAVLPLNPNVDIARGGAGAPTPPPVVVADGGTGSEERRGGKECRQ